MLTTKSRERDAMWSTSHQTCSYRQCSRGRSQRRANIEQPTSMIRRRSSPRQIRHTTRDGGIPVPSKRHLAATVLTSFTAPQQFNNCVIDKRDAHYRCGRISNRLRRKGSSNICGIILCEVTFTALIEYLRGAELASSISIQLLTTICNLCTELKRRFFFKRKIPLRSPAIYPPLPCILFLFNPSTPDNKLQESKVEQKFLDLASQSHAKGSRSNGYSPINLHPNHICPITLDPRSAPLIPHNKGIISLLPAAHCRRKDADILPALPEREQLAAPPAQRHLDPLHAAIHGQRQVPSVSSGPERCRERDVVVDEVDLDVFVAGGRGG